MIAQLKAILKPDSLQGLDTGDSFILEERQRNQEDTRVELIGISSPFLAVRMNKLNHLSALKPEKDKWNQICDYLLIGQANGSDYAIFVELKKTLREEEKPKEQLRRSLPILEYLLSVLPVQIMEKMNSRYALPIKAFFGFGATISTTPEPFPTYQSRKANSTTLNYSTISGT